MSPSISVRELPKDASDKDIDAATYIAVKAFEDDKFSSFLIGGHKSLLPSIQRALIKAALIGGKVYVAEFESAGVVGVAAWFGPGEELLGSEGQAEAGFNQFMADLGSKDPDMPAWWMEYFLPKYGEFTSEVLGGTEYKLNGWHLQLICVVPSHQRRGVGTALIKFAEAEASKSPDAESKHFTLETETEGARAFYLAVGFSDKGETIIESEKKLADTVPMWCLAKELPRD